MLNLQNVANLSIAEGNVRTIHDSNSNLLWGRLTYNTHYAGDTFQQSYTGKNQLDYSYSSIKTHNAGSGRTWDDIEQTLLYNGITYKFNNDGTILVSGTATGASYLVLVNALSFLNSGSEYILNGCPSGGSVSTYSLRIYLSGSYHTDSGSGYDFTYSSEDIVRINISNGTVLPDEGILFQPMIRLASISDSSYEPYVGGVPAPNPSYPQPISVVTGTQTVTLSDGSNSEAYTVNLGTIELCKIDTYQDYIYKSGDDWHIHKVISQISFDGTETWTQVNSYAYFSTTISDDIIRPSDIYTKPLILSDNYLSASRSNLYDSAIDYGIGIHENTPSRILIRNKDCASIPAFTTWLSGHNTLVYYVLQTPTDTIITNTTLISQLEAIEKFVTRYGYNSSVLGNLPILIQKTNI